MRNLIGKNILKQFARRPVQAIRRVRLLYLPIRCKLYIKDKLQKFQSRAARVITGTIYEIRSADVLETLVWENLDIRRSYTKSVLIYKILNEHTAPNLKGSFKKRSEYQNIYNHPEYIVPHLYICIYI